MKRKLLALLLVCAAMLALPACGKREEEPDMDRGIQYLPEFRKLDVGISEIRDACILGDAVYLTGQVSVGQYERENCLLRVPLEGGEAEALPVCEAAGQVEANVIASAQDFVCVCPGSEDTLWVMEKVGRWYYDFPEDFDLETEARGQYFVRSAMVYVLYHLDGSGQELSRVEWPAEELEARLGLTGNSFCFIQDMKVDAAGDLFFRATIGGSAGVLAVLDTQGELLFRLGLEENDYDWGNLVALGDGRMGITQMRREMDGYATYLCTVDQEAGDWGESFRLSGGGYTRSAVYDGGGDVLFYYEKENDLLAWRGPGPEGGAVEAEEENPRILNWINTGVKASYDTPLAEFLPDGRLVVIESKYLEKTGGQLELVVLTPTENPPERVVLTLGTAGLSTEMEVVVREFNRTNANYQVEVRDYIDYSQGYDWSAAMTRLATDVGAGNMPDILATGGMPVARWASGGLLEDLWPWIDLDRDIGREDLMERVFDAVSINGKLYEVGNSFCIQTVAGAKSIVGGRLSWTTEEMWDALESMPEGCLVSGDNKSSILSGMLSLDWDRFVDWERGTCRFDSGEFRALLEYCNRFPEDWPVPADRVNRLKDGQQMLMCTSIGSFEEIQEHKAFFGGEVSYVGYPNDWSEAGSCFGLSEGCAMTSACKDKEGAWAFLRTLLLPRNRADNFRTAFSTNREDFQRLAREAMKPGERNHMVDYGNIQITYRAATQAEYDQIMELYNAAEGAYRTDSALSEIIMENAGAYFAGDKTVDEAVELIQRRAQLYVDEQS